MKRPRVHLYTLAWNEADMLGFFFRHYDPWVDRYVVFDDGSTDGSLEILRSHPRVDLRAFVRTDPDSFVLSQQFMLNESWKESRGQADWVVVVDIDEHLLLRGRPMGGYLAEQQACGATLLPAIGFDLNHPAMPENKGVLRDIVIRGRPRPAYSKLSIFNPDAIREVAFSPGRHTARPVGDPVLPARDEIMLWHYKHLSFERNLAREAAQAARLGKVDIANGFSFHVLRTPQEQRTFWDEMERETRDLGVDGFDPVMAGSSPFWWDGLPELTRAGATPAPAIARQRPPAVSVLVKSYNHESYVRQTVESVLDQSFQDFEIVVTDDGSSDATADILRTFEDPRIRLEVWPENRGISSAMNATIARARGRYLAILNSDDWALPGRLRTQVEFLDGNRDIAAVFGMPVGVDDAGRPATLFNAFELPLAFPDFRRQRWLRHFFFHGNCLCAPTAMIRREVYETVGRYDPRLANLQDFDMWIRVLIAGYDIHVLPDTLTAFRVRAGNANMSAARPDTRLRTIFETVQILRHFSTIGTDVFNEVFGGDGVQHLSDDAAVPLRVADLALRRDESFFQCFGLLLLHEQARTDHDFERLRELTGRTDLFRILALEECARRESSVRAALEESRQVTAQLADRLRRAEESLSRRAVNSVKASFARLTTGRRDGR